MVKSIAHGIALVNDHILDSSEEEGMIIIAADGVGYGDDSGAWGGEILYTNIKDYERLGSLMPQNMPGGDLCTLQKTCDEPECWEQTDGLMDDELVERIGSAISSYISQQ